MENVVIVSAFRSPTGKFKGFYSDVSACELGSQVLKHAIKDIQLDVSEIDEVIMGNVLSAGLGQNIARQIAQQAGLPDSVSAFSVNKVCGSGMKAIQLGAQAIQLGNAKVVVVGGVENMTQAPHILKGSRMGLGFGDASLIDSMVYDGLTDAMNHESMGLTAERLAEMYDIDREMQDRYALESQLKAATAVKNGAFQDEIVPIYKVHRNQEYRLDQDESIRFGSTLESLSTLRPAFKKEGSVTAGNASSMNDGASVLILMSESHAQKLNLPILAYYQACVSAGVDPKLMGLGPVEATKKLLKTRNIGLEDIDLIESNEAFAAQSLAVAKLLDFDDAKVNINGGAIALGHPIGSSGARIVVSLVHALRRNDKKTGLATLCIGGGQGMALLIHK